MQALHTMSVAGFNKQILAQKLSKLNSSQQSIESILLASFSIPINLTLSFLHEVFFYLNFSYELFSYFIGLYSCVVCKVQNHSLKLQGKKVVLLS